MNIFRVFGYIGLAALALVGVVATYLSSAAGNLGGIFTSAGMFVLLAVFANALWVSGERQRRPYASVAPSRTLWLWFMAFGGLFSIALSIERFLAGAWMFALVPLLVALVLLEETYRALFRQT